LSYFVASEAALETGAAVVARKQPNCRLAALKASALSRRLLGTTSMVALGLVLATSTPSRSANDFWTGSPSTDWFTATNWSTGAVPTSADTALINTVTPAVVGAAGAQAFNLYVGYISTGTLTIQNGGTLSSASGAVGYNSGLASTATVTGTGSSWTNSANLFVGDVGAGALSIQNGGAVNSGVLYVGNFGTGTLTIQTGGTLSNGLGAIGFLSGSTGTATVDGAGSAWTNSSDLHVGQSGTGTLTIQNGGAVSNFTGVLGYIAGSTGTATVDGAGSAWTNSGNFYVGYSGAGTLTIQNGGNVSNVGTGYLGFNGGSTGTATVDGAGSAWTNSGNLLVGYSGAGTLTIQNGGNVSNVNGFLGYTAGSTGTVTVDGAGSAWTNSFELYVGRSGAGTLTIQNGGKVSNSTGYLGYIAGSTGTATVDGAGSAWTNSGNLYVGFSGAGTLTIRNGGKVSNVNSVLGYFAGSTGTVTVDGAGSSWTNSAGLTVGFFGSGTLTIANGGAVSAAAGMTIASQAGSTGTLNIGAASGQAAAAPGTLTTPSVAFGAGTGGIVFNHTASNYTFAPIISGAGSVTVENGTTILTATNTYSGPTTVNGGVLQLGNGGTTGSILGNVLNNATLAFNRSNAYQFDSAISGTGGVQQNGVGTTTLTAANTYTGTTSVNAGTLSVTGSIGSTGTPSGAINVLAGATLNVGATGAINIGTSNLTNAGTVTVAAGGSIVDDLINSGVVNNAGTYTANVQNSSPGVTTNQLGGIWIGNVTSNTGAIANMGTWTGTVTNSGTFNNNAGGTVSGLLTNNSGTTTNAGALNGGVVVNGGLLTVNGTAAAVTVNAGGTLGGNGIVGNTTINGGVLSPGNSIGLLTVQGNLVFTAAASYLVEVSPSNADRTNVTGTATLGGAAVNASFAAGTYVAKQYTILNATGGVSGTFGAEVNSNLPANFHTSLSYDANNSYLNLLLNFAVPTGLNSNQQNVGNALTNFFNTTGGIPLVFGALSPAGLTQASGEVATGSQQTTFDAMGLFMGLLTDPLVAGRGDPVSASSGAPQFAEQSDRASAYADNGKPRTRSERDAYAAIYRKAPPMADPFAQRWSVWAAGYGGSQTTDGNAGVGSNTATSRIAGTAVGADYRFSPFTLAGFALAGGGTNFSIANGLGSGRSDLFQAGAFVRHTAGPAYISAALAYGWQDITTDRTVTIAGVDQLRAQFNANAFSGRVEGGYRFVSPWMGGVGITPYSAGQFTTFDLPAYAEQAVSGTNTFALTYGSKSVTASRSELGLRSDKSFAMADGIFTLRGRAAWAHDFNTDRNIGATFQTVPGASFVVGGAAQASDSALVTASVEKKWLNGWSAAATFEGEFSDVTRSYAGKGVARYNW